MGDGGNSFFRRVLDAFFRSEKNEAEARKLRTEKFLTSEGIAISKELPYVPTSREVKYRSLDEICRRAIGSLLAVQFALHLSEGNEHNEAIKEITPFFEQFGALDFLNEKELTLIEGDYSEQDVVDVCWTYESYWALTWALGFIDDISDASEVCDCERAYESVTNSDSFEDFKSKCVLRPLNETLDMLDLYYRYHWATVERQLRPNTPIGNLNPEVVVERRRGLEWLVVGSDGDLIGNNWFEVELDT